MKRILKSDLPKSSRCPYELCVYNEKGMCDDVRTNKGNDDALCFDVSNRVMLELLEGLK